MDSFGILYEDDNIIAVDKPCGMPVIPTRRESEAPSLKQRLSQRLGKDVFVVHRIDEATSGAVVFAKDAATHRHLNALFESKAVEKTYLAIAEGELPATGSIDAPLRTYGSGRIGVDSINGKPSLTDFKLIKKLRGASLAEIYPRSGRRHQIRVHLYHIGHPVLGDALYGNKRPVGGAARLMLHACKIAFTDIHGRKLSLEAPVSADFTKIMESLFAP
ncbi:MAG: RluA family pseudouridine synthase [Elusimicrobiota bacterium]